MHEVLLPEAVPHPAFSLTITPERLVEHNRLVREQGGQ